MQALKIITKAILKVTKHDEFPRAAWSCIDPERLPPAFEKFKSRENAKENSAVDFASAYSNLAVKKYLHHNIMKT